ncbi:MAG TPA: trehalose-phosphatase [Ktedonobacteraceae bacterium]|nr:trehalose-phosphatase [Ktedonobacteraceae bacterium]
MVSSNDLKIVLAQRPLGLIFDIDGTLSPMAPTSDEARLYPGVVPLLERLSERAHVAIMTGRAIDDGARLVNVDGLTYIGTHGLEWCDGLPSLHRVEIVPEALQYIEPGTFLLDLVEKDLPNLPGVYVQRKHVGGTLHYRLSSDPEGSRMGILAILEEPARRLNMRLREGRMMVEVLAPLAVNKGQALRRFVEHFRAQGVVFAGDDLTDLDAVLEVGQLRAEKKVIAGLSVVVQHADTLPEMLEHADVVVQEVAGMVNLLRDMVDILFTAP